MDSKNLTYVFWLYGWSDSGRFLSAEDLVRCDVTQEQIHIDSQPVKEIRLETIHDCVPSTVGGRTFRRHLARLRSRRDGEKDMYIFPANPLYPANEQSNSNEVNAFCEVVNALISNRIAPINPNPYYRNMNEMHWAGVTPNSYTSPWVYYHRYRRKPTLKRVILQIIVSFVVLVALLMLLAIIADKLSP
jgi:hypothetical protein